MGILNFNIFEEEKPKKGFGAFAALASAKTTPRQIADNFTTIGVKKDSQLERIITQINQTPI